MCVCVCVCVLECQLFRMRLRAEPCCARTGWEHTYIQTHSHTHAERQFRCRTQTWHVQTYIEDLTEYSHSDFTNQTSLQKSLFSNSLICSLHRGVFNGCDSLNRQTDSGNLHYTKQMKPNRRTSQHASLTHVQLFLFWSTERKKSEKI